MIKKLCILLLSACTVAPLMAQQYGSEDMSFRPKKGQWQVSVVLGSGSNFDQNTDYLLPKYSNTNMAPGIGVGDATTNQSTDPGLYLNLGDWNNNSLVNIAGIQGQYFITDHWSVNLMFSMNINLTPKKDFIEGDYQIKDMVLPNYRYMEGRMTNNWMVNVGSNYYFHTRNERINPYVGGMFGWQMGRIETTTPYTGNVATVWDETANGGDGGYVVSPDEDPEQLYVPNSRAGQIFGLQVGAVAGIEFSICKGLILGAEVQPFAYRWDRLQVCPKGMTAYQANHHNFKLFSMPNLKIGFRF